MTRYRIVDGVLTPWDDPGARRADDLTVADLPECRRCGGRCSPHQCMDGNKAPQPWDWDHG